VEEKAAVRDIEADRDNVLLDAIRREAVNVRVLPNLDDMENLLVERKAGDRVNMPVATNVLLGDGIAAAQLSALDRFIFRHPDS
jgi:hypothetical protein